MIPWFQIFLTTTSAITPILLKQHDARRIHISTARASYTQTSVSLLINNNQVAKSELSGRWQKRHWWIISRHSKTSQYITQNPHNLYGSGSNVLCSCCAMASTVQTNTRIPTPPPTTRWRQDIMLYLVKRQASKPSEQASKVSKQTIECPSYAYYYYYYHTLSSLPIIRLNHRINNVASTINAT
jgi:hypothetical protein